MKKGMKMTAGVTMSFAGVVRTIVYRLDAEKMELGVWVDGELTSSAVYLCPFIYEEALTDEHCQLLSVTTYESRAALTETPDPVTADRADLSEESAD